jgi:hypothetical protein
MMRIARVLAASSLLLGTAFVAAPAGASSRSAPPSATAATVTTTTKVVAVCQVTPPLDPPRTQEYTVTVTAPRRVAPGSQATIEVSVDYPIPAHAQFGDISVRAQQTGDTGVQQFIYDPSPGAPRVEGTATFPVTGPAGSEIAWTVDSWAQGAFFGGSAAGEICTPTTPISVPATRIGSGFALPPALRHLLEHVCAKPSLPRPLAVLCRLLG